jgi:hypothetical protein
MSLKTDLRPSISFERLHRNADIVRTAAGEASATDAATIAIMAESFMMSMLLSFLRFVGLVRVFGSDSFREQTVKF